MKRRRVFLLVPPLIFVAILGIRLLLNLEPEAEPPQSTQVVTSTPAIGVLEETLRYPGTLMPARTVTLLPKTSGKIETILVEEGDRVEKDQVVVTLDREVTELKLKQAEANYRSAEAQYKKAVKGARAEEIENTRALVLQAEKELATARTNLERIRTLYEAGGIAKSKLEEAEIKVSSGETRLENAKRSLSMLEQGSLDEELEMASSNMEAAKAQYELARLQYQHTQVKAPASGLVARIMVDEGNMASSNVPLMTIVHDDIIYAKVNIPEKYFGRLADKGTGFDARVLPIAFPENHSFTGTVTSISPVIDASSRTFTVEIAVENSGHQLRPGMYVNVELVLERREKALLVPESSLVFRDDGHVVFTTVSDRASTGVETEQTDGRTATGVETEQTDGRTATGTGTGAGTGTSGTQSARASSQETDRESGQSSVRDSGQGSQPPRSDAVARMKPVSVGLRKDGHAEILAGLTNTDRIIIRGNAFLEDGQKITVVEDL
jgi:multidrug efflux pump subunit AcrA (membrane-fusion protein)